MTTKRIPIEQLSGAALDWAVGASTGVIVNVEVNPFPQNGSWRRFLWAGAGKEYSPSTDWSQCGPLIERYKVDLEHFKDDWRAEMWDESLSKYVHLSHGDTPLIAACRAIVAAHNPSGYVEVPEELVEPIQ